MFFIGIGWRLMCHLLLEWHKVQVMLSIGILNGTFYNVLALLNSEKILLYQV